jgi:hypothetical protein
VCVCVCVCVVLIITYILQYVKHFVNGQQELYNDGVKVLISNVLKITEV